MTHELRIFTIKEYNEIKANYREQLRHKHPRSTEALERDVDEHLVRELDHVHCAYTDIADQLQDGDKLLYRDYYSPKRGVVIYYLNYDTPEKLKKFNYFYGIIRGETNV